MKVNQVYWNAFQSGTIMATLCINQLCMDDVVQRLACWNIMQEIRVHYSPREQSSTAIGRINVGWEWCVESGMSSRLSMNKRQIAKKKEERAGLLTMSTSVNVCMLEIKHSLLLTVFHCIQTFIVVPTLKWLQGMNDRRSVIPLAVLISVLRSSELTNMDWEDFIYQPRI